MTDGVAAFTADAVTGIPGAIITFTNTSTNLANAWSWYCYDNETESTNTEVSSCLFAAEGSYSIRLNASNGVTYDWENKTNYITIANATTPATTTTGMSRNGNHRSNCSGVITNRTSVNWGRRLMITGMFGRGTMGRDGQ